MRAPIPATVLWLAWVIAAGGDDTRALSRAVADLSADDFARRERATRILWESGAEAVVADIVRHGATTEARARAAQVLNSYRWGIAPGVAAAVIEQLQLFRNGSLTTRSSALSNLMQMGELRAAARCVLLVENAVKRQRLNEVLRARLGESAPREFVRGRREEVRGFLEQMAVAEPEYQRDLDALLSGDISDGALIERLPRAMSDPKSRALQAPPPGWLLRPGFDMLYSQGRITEAVESLRVATDVDSATPATEVIRAFLAREAAQAQAPLYSKKALNLPKSVAYQPAGIVLSDGLRSVLGFCHTYGLNELTSETGAALATRLETVTPFALPTFCAWAARYPEMRDTSITAAMKARQAGIPAEFAFAPLVDEHSFRTRWFGQFTTRRERRLLLENGVRNGGWGRLSDVAPALLPTAVKGRLAMTVGDWTSAAAACAEAAENADTLATGAVQAFFASIAHQHAGNPDMTAKWRAIAEAIPLGDEEARSALADTMHRFSDAEGARRNRMLLLHLHAWGTFSEESETSAIVHALRLSLRSARLIPNANRGALVRSLFSLLWSLPATQQTVTGRGEVLRDCEIFYQNELRESIESARWSEAVVNFRSAHRCTPGDLQPFEDLASHTDELAPADLVSLRKLLAETTRLWLEAVASFPNNARCARQLQRCRALRGQLAP